MSQELQTSTENTKNAITLAFESLTQNFTSSILSPVIDYVIENFETLSLKPSQERSTLVAKELSLAPPSISPVRSGISSAPNLSLIQKNLPATQSLRGLGAPQISAKSESGTKTARGAKQAQVWYETVDEFLAACEGGKMLCSYTPPRGQHHTKFCGSEANAVTEGSIKDWRCNTCKGKKGNGEKLLNSAINGVGTVKASTVSTGFNATTRSLPARQPPLPSMSKPMSMLPSNSSTLPRSLPFGIPKRVEEHKVEEVNVIKIVKNSALPEDMAFLQNIHGVLIKFDENDDTIISAYGKYKFKPNENPNDPNAMESDRINDLMELNEQEIKILGSLNIEYTYYNPAANDAEEMPVEQMEDKQLPLVSSALA